MSQIPGNLDLLQLVPTQDTVGEMETAREDRYWDALATAMESREFAVCYLLGYVVEMAPKTAFFRISGEPSNAPLGPLLKKWQPPTSSGKKDLHNLRDWADALIDTRKRLGRPLEPALATKLISSAAWASKNWAPNMRYKASVPAQPVVERFVGTVDWFRAKYVDFWR